MDAVRYPIRIGRRSAPLLRVAFGVTPAKAWATLGDRELRVRFGWYRFDVPLANVAGWRIEGPWCPITAIGVRLGLRHGDLTFAGSAHGGVRLDFCAPVRWGPLRVPVLYIGIDDPEGFAARLSGLGVEGRDVRHR